MLHEEWQPLRNFTTDEKSRIITEQELTKSVTKNVIPADDDEKFVLRRFAVYAFPTYCKEPETIFPAMLKYTGDLLDTAIVRRYKVNVSAAFMGDFESVASLDGTIFPMSPDYIESHGMIKVNGGDMVQSDQLVSVFSALEKMLSGVVKKPALIKLDQVFTAVKETWKISKSISSVTVIIAELQRALVILEKLPCEFPVDGTLNYETLDALEGIIGKGFELSPKTFEYVINLTKDKY